MGGDGGCHPNGRKFMQGTMEKSREDKQREAPPDKREQLLIRTRTCALSNDTLEVGMKTVSDEIGNLFSKETLLTALVEKNLPPEFEHIRGLRDVIELKFHLNPDAPTKGTDIDWSTDTWSPYSCPIANVEMNGRYPFVAIRRQQPKKSKLAIDGKMGGATRTIIDERVNVISEKAFKEVGSDALQEEYGPFDPENDVIKLVPNDVERLEMIQNLSNKRKLEKAEKKNRKSEKRKQDDESKNEHDDKGETDKGETEPKSTTKKLKDKTSSVSSVNHKSFIPKPSLGSQSTKNFFGSVMNETEKALDGYGASNDTFSKLFHGAGSQKPSSAKEQFIVQSGKRGNLG